VANAKSVQDFQEMANSMRTIAEIRRAFTYNAGRAMAVRGTAEELAMVDWLLKQLDKPGPQSQASEEFRLTGAADDVMRVFYLPPAQPVQAFQQSAAQIRTTLQIRRVFTYNALRAVSVRGTESQLALTQHMIEEIRQ
jgi:DNA-binding FadR family transcriptional regulator